MFSRGLIARQAWFLRNYSKTFANTSTSLSKPVVGITLGDKFDTAKLLQEYSQNFSKLPKSDVIYGTVSVKDSVLKFLDVQNQTIQQHEGKQDSSFKEIFIVPKYGSVCLFDVSEEHLPQYSPLINELQKYIDGDRSHIESEELDYKIVTPGSVETATPLDEDTLTLVDDANLKKLQSTVSLAMCRSTKLAVLEIELEKHIHKTKGLIYELYRHGTLKSKKESEIVKYCGELFIIRGKLNLYDELIDQSPDVYWSETCSNLEKQYLEISKQLDVMIRINTLNKKLDYATDEMKALLSVLNEQKGTRLEWIIIWLITVEVVFALYHNYERYFLNK